jgi:hypothetical protein
MSAHGCNFTIISRDPNVWRARCNCKRRWDGPSYEVVEDYWREHVHAAIGKVVEPAGNQGGRWTP